MLKHENRELAKFLSRRTILEENGSITIRNIVSLSFFLLIQTAVGFSIVSFALSGMTRLMFSCLK